MSTSLTTQQGIYRIHMHREDWEALPKADREYTREWLHVRLGIVSGEITALAAPQDGLAPTAMPVPRLSHRLTNRGRNGMIRTTDDTIVDLEFENSRCWTATDIEGVPMPLIPMVTEEIYPFYGTGVYRDLVAYDADDRDATSWFRVRGTINSCPEDDDYLKNDFELVADEGQLCFDPTRME